MPFHSLTRRWVRSYKDFLFRVGLALWGTNSSCCTPPLLGGSPAQMWASWGLRVSGETKARWSAAENQAHTTFSVIGQVRLLDLIRIFLFVYIFIWRRYGCTCYQYSEVKPFSSDYSNASMCVGILEWQKVSEQRFFKGFLFKAGQKNNLPLWKNSWGLKELRTALLWGSRGVCRVCCTSPAS